MSDVDVERSERLRSVDLTSGLDRVALARLAAYMDPVSVPAGEAIITEGETGDALYIIVRGTFAVLVDGARVNTVGPGHYVGELALLIDEPRSATIRADTDGEVLRLERQQFMDLLGRDAPAARAVATTLARRLRRRDGALPDEAEATLAAIPVRAPRSARAPITKIVGLVIAIALGAAAFSPLVDLAQWRFALLLFAAVTLWVSEPVPNVVVSLGLVGALALTGMAPSYAVLQGFATLNWVFVLSVLGVAAAVARSGLLLRLGLLLIERVPARPAWQSATFLLTGIVLTPLLPLAMARAAITAPLAEGVSDTMKLPARGPASAALGLSAWIGSGPLMFLFMNGSTACLVAWSLMPIKDEVEFTWTQWFLSAAPLGAIIAVGSFVAMRVMFRTGPRPAPARAPLRLQRAILGPPSTRELLILAIVASMLIGWIVGPQFLWPPGLVALFAFIAVMIVAGVSDLKNLDWEYLIFFGVLLSIAEVAKGLSLDKIVGNSAATWLTQLGLGGAGLVILAGVVTILVKSLLAADQAVLLLSFAFIPVATAVNISPWLVAVAILALGLSWHVPAQSPEYLVAYGATHGRLYSHAQGRRMALVYEAIALAGLAICLPYWHLLGYL
ncbi:MAG TPA: SLC13 family permease [Candidatus Limnocylindria bacterium]|jgi:DASS family divalent anion:Na+ symporter